MPRDLSFSLDERADPLWLDGDLFKTAIFDCFALLLPEGERFFARTINHFKARAEGEAARQAIEAFLTQEALHAREHRAYNEGLRKLGQDVDAMEAPARLLLRQKVTDPLDRLAKTCAIEHVTLTLAVVTLRNPRILEGASEPYRGLWTWHALEELEHAAVALAVWKDVTRDSWALRRYLHRIWALTFMTAWIAHRLTSNMKTYLRCRGIASPLHFWRGYLRVLLVDPGYIRSGFGVFVRYYLPRFDPGRHQDPQLIARGRAMLSQALNTRSQASPLN